MQWILHFLSLLVSCISIRGIKLTPSEDNDLQHTSEYYTPTVRHNHTEVLCRRRRYLLFEKGAVVSISTSSVKSIQGTVPRGLNIISEESLYYDLPSSVTIPTVKPPPSTKPPFSPTNMKTKLMHRSSYISPGYTSYHRIHKRNVHSTESTEDSTKESGGDYFDSKDIEAALFQQIDRLAKIYGFNGQHCIMRTICEAQHFLYPRGQSLFHDIIGIILEFAWPTIRNNKKYLKAFSTANPMDCENLYGPHCRISFLDYFTVQVHGKFM